MLCTAHEVHALPILDIQRTCKRCRGCALQVVLRLRPQSEVVPTNFALRVVLRLCPEKEVLP